MDTTTTTTMRDQAGIMKGSIDTLDLGIFTAGGTIITATSQSPIKSIVHTRIKNIVIRPMKSMAISQVMDTADKNTHQKAIPTESLSN